MLGTKWQLSQSNVRHFQTKRTRDRVGKLLCLFSFYTLPVRCCGLSLYCESFIHVDSFFFFFFVCLFSFVVVVFCSFVFISVWWPLFPFSGISVVWTREERIRLI